MTALYFIGGINATVSLNGFTQPATNSYKRLAQASKPGHVGLLWQPFRLIQYSLRVEPESLPYRAASRIRMPTRTYLRSTVDGYLDGIQNKIHLL